MTIFFSASSAGFFDNDLHKHLPPDAVEISETQHAALLAAQGEGKVIVMIAGAPQPLDPPPLDPAAQCALIRLKRDRLLANTDKIVTVPDFPISPARREELLPWRAALRDVTESLDPASPFDTVAWPQRPSWLDENGTIALEEN